MRVVSLFIIGVHAEVTPLVTVVYTAFILKLLSSSVSIVSVAISLIIVVLIIITIPSFIVSSRFTVFFAIGE